MRGFTLIELMVVVLVLGLIFGVGLPKISYLIDRYQSDTAVKDFYRLLMMTRTTALENSKSFTLCVLDRNHCSPIWNGTITIFEDTNENAILDSGESVLWSTPAFSKYGTWTKKRATQPFVRFNESGHAFSSATTFLFCPDSGEYSYAKQVVISFQGRVRIQPYLSSLGTPYASVNPLSCG